MVALNVAQLLLSLPGTTREADFSERLADPTEDARLAGPVRGHVHLTRTSRGILAHVTLAARVIQECGRCLADARTTVQADVDEEFFPTVDIRTGVPVGLELEREPEDYALIDEHHELGLDEVIRQTLITSLPLQPLCEEACPGLCPTCGQRLDAKHQRHPEDEAVEDEGHDANPFATLAVLLRQPNDQPPPSSGENRS